MLATLDLDPFADDFLANPYAYHPALREAGAVVWLSSIGVFALARFAEVQAALADHATFCSGRGVGIADFSKEEPWRPPSLLLEADPPLHTRTRTLMNRIVSLGALKELRGPWEQHAEALVDSLVRKRRFDAVLDLSEAFPMRVFADAVGVPQEGREHLLTYAAATFNAFGPRNAIFHAGNERAREAIGWISAACLRENLSPNGWGARIYEACDRGECTQDEAEKLVRSLLSAGVDTTVNGIGQMVLAFASHPAEWAKLQQRPQLARKCFDESLRWDSTVQTFFRTATRSTEVAGVTIPEGAKVLLFLASANRDPRRWVEPERFDLDREAAGHVGFGFGLHRCLGQMVARQEAELVLQALLKRVHSIRLTAEPIRRLNNTLRAIASLPVEVEPLT